MSATAPAGLPGTAPPHGDGLRAALGRWFVRAIERQARTDEIRRLEAMSDRELAARGIRRDRIVHHVFRDRLGWV